MYPDSRDFLNTYRLSNSGVDQESYTSGSTTSDEQHGQAQKYSGNTGSYSQSSVSQNEYIDLKLDAKLSDYTRREDTKDYVSKSLLASYLTVDDARRYMEKNDFYWALGGIIAAAFAIGSIFYYLSYQPLVEKVDLTNEKVIEIESLIDRTAGE